MLRPSTLALAVSFTLSLHAIAQQTPPPTPPQTSIPHNAPLNPTLPTVFIVGDSTARNSADLGWGDHFAQFFDTSRINVANRAIAGRSARSYIDEGHWATTLAEMKSGRLSPSADGPQRRRRPRRRQTARRPQRHRRRHPGRRPDHRPLRRKDRDHPHLRLVPPQNDRRRQSQRRPPHPPHAHHPQHLDCPGRFGLRSHSSARLSGWLPHRTRHGLQRLGPPGRRTGRTSPSSNLATSKPIASKPSAPKKPRRSSPRTTPTPAPKVPTSWPRPSRP